MKQKRLSKNRWKGLGVFFKVGSLIAILFCCAPFSANAESNEIAQQQFIKITGTVYDKTTAETIPGVSVRVKGTDDATTTDFDGKFTINVPYAYASLTFSYTGYQPIEVALEGRVNVDVELTEDTQHLKEVVVVGYNVQKKETIVGSVATITTKDLQQSPTANLNNALAGRLPGLIATQFGGGETGVDVSSINIRGLATYAGSSDPIIIIDGVERDMRFLAPEEIESFTILKDASATAAYGIRGANGVIIISTKRGKAQDRATVNFKASAGVMSQAKYPSYLGSADYAMLYNEAQYNQYGTWDIEGLFPTEQIERFRNGEGYNWDYFDYAFKPGSRQDYSLSLRGGDSHARYYVMANYYKETGNYRYADITGIDNQAKFQRYNFRANVDVDITKDFYAKLDLGAQITDRNAPGTTAARVIQIANTQAPYLPITIPNDNVTEENKDYYTNNDPYGGVLYGDYTNRFNILGELGRSGYQNEKNTYLNGSFVMGHKLDFITKGLKAEGTFSYDASEGRWITRKIEDHGDGTFRTWGGYATFQPDPAVTDYTMGDYYKYNTTDYEGKLVLGNPTYDQDRTPGNGLSHNASVAKTYLQLKMDYDRSFGVHDVTGMVLVNRTNERRNNDPEFRRQGITGRATYAFDSRYLAEFNFGYNGSENFAPGHRYGFFPAGAVGWMMSNESFMESTKSWLDNLKLRASLGLTGNDRISGDRFGYLATYGTSGGYTFGTPGSNTFGSEGFNTGGAQGYKEGRFANEDLTWEKSRKFNVGIDATLLKGQLTITADYFNEHRYDIIDNLTDATKMGYPALVGQSPPPVNTGKVDNQGIDFEIGWNGKIGKDFRYSIRPNFTYAKNKINFQSEVARENFATSRTGHAINSHFLLEFSHFVYDQEEADRLNAMNDGDGFQPYGKLSPGDVVYKDQNGDGKIDELNDRVHMGYPRTPEIQFGIPVTLMYKGFDFSMLWQGSANTSVMLKGAATWAFPSFDQDKVGKVKPMHLDRWAYYVDQDGTQIDTRATAKYPRITYGTDPNNKNQYNSLFLYDAKYIRLKSAEIGYSLPKSAIRFAGLQNVRIYAQGLNLLTFDGLGDVDVDPEHSEDGMGTWYPIQRTWNFGIDITY